MICNFLYFLNVECLWKPVESKYKSDLKGSNYQPGKTATYVIDKKKNVLKISLVDSTTAFLTLDSYRLSSGKDLSKIAMGTEKKFSGDYSIFTGKYDTEKRQNALQKIFGLLSVKDGVMQYEKITSDLHKEIYEASKKGRPEIKKGKNDEDLSKLSYDDWVKKASVPKYRPMAFGGDEKKLKEPQDFALIQVAFDELEMREIEVDLDKLGLSSNKEPHVFELGYNTNLLSSRGSVTQSPPIVYDGSKYSILDTRGITERGWFFPVVFFAVASILLTLSIVFIKNDKLKENKKTA
ncbi:hypothetical protein EHP00_1217 [Ecytonucleospora hepatopenaei]|uniref:Uncharacterized protein n=1 Tax=Ecytonucleospora hepatopenaei TaxID=646526 RepID=A0A1W0E827_9MICR|nr:hypothetical protein EHP00_1217 [Ecytonucleospora hepatopenaei]